NKIVVEIEKLKKEIKNKLKQKQIIETEQQKKKEVVHSKEEQTNKQNKFKFWDDIEIVQTTIAAKGEGVSLRSGHKSPFQRHDLDKRNASKECNFELFRKGTDIKTYNGHSSTVCSIDYLPFVGGHFFCSGSLDEKVMVWSLYSGRPLFTFRGHHSSVHCVKFSPYDYNAYSYPFVLCSASNDSTICFWDFGENEQIQTLYGHDAGVSSIQFSPFNGGRYLCSGSYDKTICLWDIETFTQLNVFRGHKQAVRCIEFSPLQSNSNSNRNSNVIGGSGYTICSGSVDNTIRVWDVETFKPLVMFKGHEDTVNSVKYSPFESGNTLCSGSWDKTVRLWDIRSQSEIHVLKGHGSNVNCVEYSPFISGNDNEIKIGTGGTNIICSGSLDNTIRFWDVRNSKQLLEINDHDKDSGIYCLLFLPCQNRVTGNDKSISDDYGSILYYGSGKGRIQAWG
ncbi:hypothetical protein RFI_05598, partial [Reticulomyxa filosa]